MQPDDRQVVSGELVLVEELTSFHFDELDELFVVDHVALVQEHNDVGNANLTASRMCSRVWAIGPSVAAITRIAPSI